MLTPPLDPAIKRVSAGYAIVMGAGLVVTWIVLLATGQATEFRTTPLQAWSLLAFACFSLFQWRAVLETELGRAVALLICLVWVVRSAAEVVFFRVGLDSAWWRLALFLACPASYIPAVLHDSSARRAYHDG